MKSDLSLLRSILIAGLLFVFIAVRSVAGDAPAMVLPRGSGLTARIELLPGGKDRELSLQVTVRNQSNERRRFTFRDSWGPILFNAAGQEISVGGGRDATRATIPKDFPVLQPGAIYRTTMECLVEPTDDGLLLRISDWVGGWFECRLTPGRYFLALVIAKAPDHVLQVAASDGIILDPPCIALGLTNSVELEVKGKNEEDPRK